MTTTPPRTLPIRVAPAPGEALDSWQEALAARLQATPGDLAAAMFPAAARRPGTTRPGSTIMLADDEAAAIAAACQVSVLAVRDLTLARYDGIALRIDRQTGRVARNFLWGRATGSRFCPACLAQTAGRWQLSWRLGWSFACLIHRRLLADACPQCGRMQRRQPHPLQLVPHPGTCGNAAPRAAGVSPPRCGADLTAAPSLILAPGHPVLTAQQFIDDIISAGRASAGIYTSCPQPAAAALADVRALAATALAAASPGDLAAVLPADIIAEYAAAVAAPHIRHSSAPTTSGIFPGALAPASAAVAAAGVTAAVQALRHRAPHDAAGTLRLTFRAEETGTWTRAREASPALHAVRLAALGQLAEPGRPRQARSCRNSPGKAGARAVLARLDRPADATAARNIPANTAALPSRRVPHRDHRGEPDQRRARARHRDHLRFRSPAPDAAPARPALASRPDRAPAPSRAPRPPWRADRLPAPSSSRLQQPSPRS